MLVRTEGLDALQDGKPDFQSHEDRGCEDMIREKIRCIQRWTFRCEHRVFAQSALTHADLSTDVLYACLSQEWGL